jgi:uncharacterized protein (TIGR02246 family)
MTYRARCAALLLPVALLVASSASGAQQVIDTTCHTNLRAHHSTAVRLACPMAHHSTPRVEHSPEVTMAHAEEELRSLLAAYETSLNAGDVGRIEQLYTEDGVFMPAGFPTAAGRTAVRGAYEAVFSNIRIAIHFTVDELSVKGDVAHARTHSAGTATVVATGSSGPEANRELFVFARSADGWKIARYMFNKAS